MDNRLNTSVIQATEEVFRDMMGVKLTSRQPLEIPINKSDGVKSEATVIISFVGEISGALMLKCSKKVGAVLAARMLGMEVEVGSDDMKDALGELLNIIIGSAKTYYSKNNAFQMSVPTTIVGQNYSLYIKANTGKSISFIPFKSGNANLGIEIYIK